MNSEDEKKLKQKIYIVIVLCIIILIAFGYLIIRDNIKKPVDPVIDNSSVIVETPDAVIETDEPVTTPEESVIPQETIEPEDTNIPEETQNPEETTVPEETQQPEETAVPDDQPNEESKVDVKTDSSLYRVVNKDNPLDRNYVPKDMIKANVAQIGTQLLRSEAVVPLEEMFKAAEKDNIHLFLISGYRSYALQYSLWETYKARYGEATARRIDSYPGTSEHQTGLSVDLGSADRKCELKACFYDTKTYKWLHENAYKYGYIERNPKGSEAITKVQESPWNFRYIGKEEAEKIHKSGKTLEEYYQLN